MSSLNFIVAIAGFREFSSIPNNYSSQNTSSRLRDTGSRIVVSYIYMYEKTNDGEEGRGEEKL